MPDYTIEDVRVIEAFPATEVGREFSVRLSTYKGAINVSVHEIELELFRIPEKILDITYDGGTLKIFFKEGIKVVVRNYHGEKILGI